MIYEFCPPEESCIVYNVKAKNLDSAIEKFLAWEAKELKEEDRWPDGVIKSKKNWLESDTIFIGFDDE